MKTIKTSFKIYILILIVTFIVACSIHKEVTSVNTEPAEAAVSAVDTEYYAMVEKPAVFNNGDIRTFMTYLKKSTKYPASALKKKQQGTAIVQFGIDWNGKLNVFSVLKSSGVKVLDNEAVRALKASPAWSPAKIKTQSVGQLFTLQIKFNAKTKSVEIN